MVQETKYIAILNLGNLQGLGRLGNINPAEGSSLFTHILSLTIGILTLVAVIWFLFVLITGAIAWLSSGGDKAKVQEAQKRITNGFIGLIIVITSIFLIKIVGEIIGINFLSLPDLSL